jgi:signal transduction histidine kinase/streptogramin lyase
MRSACSLPEMGTGKPARDGVDIRSPWRRCAGVVVLGMALFAADLGAQSRFPDLSAEWRWVDFGPASGLPGGEVAELVEVDTTVWVRTDHGVAFYDGFVWTVVGPDRGLPAAAPTSLAASPSGEIFVVAGGGIYRGGLQGFRAVRLPPPYDTVHVVRVVPDSGDAFYFTVPVPVGLSDYPQNELLYASGTDVRRVETPAPVSPPWSIWRARSGRLWIDTWQGPAVLDRGRWRLRVESPWLPRHPRATPLLGEDSSGLGIAFRRDPPTEMGLLMWRGKEPIRREIAEGTNAVASMDVRDGVAMVAYETGDLRVFDAGAWRSFSLPPSRREGVTFVHFGEHGRLWFGSSGGLRLFRSAERRWQGVHAPFPDGRNSVNAILHDRDGTTWLGTNEGVLKLRNGVEVGRITSILGQPVHVVTGLAQDSDGNVWLSGGRDIDGAFRWDGRAWHRFGQKEGLDAGRIHRVFVDRAGDVWFMSLGRNSRAEAGAYRLRGGVVEKVTRDLPMAAAYGFAESADGTVWMALEVGLARLRSGALTLFGAEQGLGRPGGEPPGTAVFDVAVDGRGRVWFCHRPAREMGLGYVGADDTIRYVDPPGGAAGRRVWSVTADVDGTIWVGSDAGVAHYRDGVWALFGAGTGLGATSVWPVVPLTRSVLVGSHGGGFFTLDRSGARSPPPRVVIGPPHVDGRVGTLRWHAFTYWGEIPERSVETRLRLDGGDWSSWSTARSQVEPGLSPGRHSVEIQAKGLFGRTTDPAAAELVILPPLALRPVFFLPVGFLLAALLVLGTTTTIRRRRDQVRHADLEAQLHRAQRLDALGKLTGGVAHDFNNLLAVAIGSLELLMEGGALSPGDIELADEALAAANRGAQLTQRLLAFSRKQPLAPTLIDVETLVSGLTRFLHGALGETISIDVRVAPDTWPVRADQVQLEHAVINLGVNARDAMPEGGRLVIDAANFHAVAEPDPNLEGLAPGQYVRLSVSDTGTGMPPTVEERAFDPFFTTKPPGTSSGLGLSMVYGFASQSGGTATIDSVEGEGTVVSIFLPRATEPTPRVR